MLRENNKKVEEIYLKSWGKMLKRLRRNIKKGGEKREGWTGKSNRNYTIYQSPLPHWKCVEIWRENEKMWDKGNKKNYFNGLEIKEKRECIAKVKDQTI